MVLYALWELETYKIEYETNGGEFLTDSVAPLYATFDELVLEFINDYSSFTGISGITAESFYGKSNQYGLYGFFKNEEMATKWNWLLNFVADMATEVGYSGKVYLMLSAGAANFNKYSRSNFAAFLQQTHLTKISPISMNFENVDSEALWAVCPTKDIQIGIEAQYEYTILDLPLELATPNKEGATFIGWYTNSDLKNGKIDKLTVDNIGNIKLYARWSDSTIHFDTFNIHYELDGGVLEEGAPTSYVEETGVALKGATRPGYTFQGWYLDAECTKGVTEITAQDKGDITLYACWEENIQVYDKELSELLVDANNPEAYKTLQDAIAAAKDGSVIRLVAGEYSLGGTLSKNIKIVGPNEGISGYDNRQEEAIINTERVDLASAYLAFDGVKLQGSDNNFIYATTTTQDILIQNCLVDKYNSFIRFEQVAAGGKIAYLNNKITNITQFFLWLKGQNGINVKSIDFIGNILVCYVFLQQEMMHW